MKQSKHRTAKLVRDYLIIFVIGAVLLYPIIWMFFASFKSNDEIFGSIRLLPQNFSFKYFMMAGRAVVRHLHQFLYQHLFTGDPDYHLYCYVQCSGCIWICQISVSWKEDPVCTAYCNVDAAKLRSHHSSLYFIQQV